MTNIAKDLKKDCIIASFEQLLEREAVNTDSFYVASMNNCLRRAKALPPIVVLYPDIVLEGDLCILFGQSGIGKTIFSMQVAKSIADKGKRVLYLDFEMSLRQLALRYQTPNFPSTFFRAELKPEVKVQDILRSIEEAAKENMADVLFIDNITALGQSLDKGQDAGELMAELNRLKKEHNWTLVVLTHVPKSYSGALPLSLSAIQGSAKLNQLVDDAIGLGISYKDRSMVYVKQCKWRNGEIVLDAEHVAVYERMKDEHGNLGLTFRGYDCESALLKAEGETEMENLMARVVALSKEGYVQKDIAAECGITQSKVSRLLKKAIKRA